MTHHAQLDDKLVDELLCELLIYLAVSKVVLDVYVEE